MTTQARDKAACERSRSNGQTAPPVPKAGHLRYLWPGWQRCLVFGSYVLSVSLCGAAVYLWRAPLPPLPVPEVADGSLATSLTVGRSGSKASLEACLRQVKIRDLFKPSIPVPSENRMGKSTAQELADRLQFVGIVREADGLAALVFIPNRGPGTFHVGDRVAEFILKDVKPDRLVLELGDEEVTLKR